MAIGTIPTAFVSSTPEAGRQVKTAPMPNAAPATTAPGAEVALSAKGTSLNVDDKKAALKQAVAPGLPNSRLGNTVRHTFDSVGSAANAGVQKLGGGENEGELAQGLVSRLGQVNGAILDGGIQLLTNPLGFLSHVPSNLSKMAKFATTT